MTLPRCFRSFGDDRNTLGTRTAHRDDIDGLRAVAIVTVLGFHLDVPWLSGGYIGVDVFFVISGYLITQVLLRDAESSHEFLPSFYERRIRRIAPALIVLLIVCAASQLWLATPMELETFSLTLAATAGFSSNLLFWRTASYFDTPAQLTPLFHTWSIALEEQFYIVYPWLFSLLIRRGKKSLERVLIALCVGSLLYSTIAALFWSRSAYFLPLSRAWELLLGCLLALGIVRPVARAAMREFLAVCGIVCIAAATIGFHSKTPFPGLAAVVPCAGVALLLHCNAASLTRIGAVLASPIPKFLGTISYSLYLWHWPLIVLWRLQYGVDLTATTRALLIALSVVVATISWRYIEQPFRRVDGVIERRALLASFAACTLGLLLFSAVAFRANGWPQRLNASAADILRYQRYHETDEFRRANNGACFSWDLKGWSDGYDVERCFTSRADRYNVLLWGDSLASQYAFSLQQTWAGRNIHLMQATRAGCGPALQGIDWRDPGCAEFTKAVLRRLRVQRVDAIVMTSDWLRWYRQSPATLDGLRITIEAARSLGIPVFLLGPGPTLDNALPVTLAHAMQRGGETRRLHVPLAKTAIVLDAVMRVQFASAPGVRYVPTLNVLCQSSLCPAMMDDKTPLLWNTDHLTLPAAHLMIERLTEGALGQIVGDSQRTRTAGGQ